MNSAYTQLIKHLDYLKFKQMINHLDEVIDFSTKNNLSFVDALIKLTAYEIDFKKAGIYTLYIFL
ncbi:hypothetical protein Z967_09535 [Clostridium novyi A str. 4540]|nr:hypothetical protein Z967_09535 [Clostridium novyi A str. 4540]